MSIISRAVLIAVIAVGSAIAASALPASVRAEEPFKQVQLDEKLIKGFISAQKDMSDYHQKSGAPTSDKPNPKVQADLDELAKKHGFASFADFDDVAFNISVVMSGLDPQSGVFTEPIAAINKEIEEIKADASIPEKDKKQMLDELAEALKNTPPMKYPGNVEIVKRFRTDIEKVLQ